MFVYVYNAQDEDDMIASKARDLVTNLEAITAAAREVVGVIEGVEQ